MNPKPSTKLIVVSQLLIKTLGEVTPWCAFLSLLATDGLKVIVIHLRPVTLRVHKLEDRLPIVLKGFEMMMVPHRPRVLKPPGKQRRLVTLKLQWPRKWIPPVLTPGLIPNICALPANLSTEDRPTRDSVRKIVVGAVVHVVSALNLEKGKASIYKVVVTNKVPRHPPTPYIFPLISPKSLTVRP